METLGLWISPLLLLPGNALLILSTSNRFERLHNEIHFIEESHIHESETTMQRLMQRAILFRNALTLLYIAVAGFCSAGLAGGINAAWSIGIDFLVLAFTFIGIVAMIWAAVLLIRESYISIDVLKAHTRHIKGNHD